jgi:pyruvate,water dikinase
MALPQVRQIAARQIAAAEDLRAIAAAGRALRLARGRVAAPSAIEAGSPRWRVPSAPVLRGHPTRGRARGRAVVVRSPAAAPPSLPPDAVLVVPAILPSLSHLLAAARALVTDHGGATSHGATLAREYGVPAVLGVGRATAIADGTALFVDGDAGRVYTLERVS